MSSRRLAMSYPGDAEDVKAAAGEAGLAFAERRAMPANNLMLLFRRT